MAINNSFTSLFYHFLALNQCAGHVQLHITERESDTVLRYDTDSKYSQNMGFLNSLPYTEYSGYDAEQLWRLLDSHGLTRQNSGITDAPEGLSPAQRLTWADNCRLRWGWSERGRWAELSAREEHDLFLYLEAQDVESSLPPKTGLIEFSHPSEVYSLTNKILKRWNDRNELELEQYFTRELWTELNPFSNARSTPNLWPQVKPYTFCDAIEAATVTDATFRPFSFAGVLLHVSSHIDDPLALTLIIRDARYPAATQDSAYQRHVTAQYCQEYRYDRLILSPRYHDWVSKTGRAHPKMPGILSLTADKLPNAPVFRH